MKNKLIYSMLFISALAFFSCKKVEGPGGRATITGKVTVRDYNSSFTVLNGVYVGQGVTVYITYGSQVGVGNSVKTDANGVFRFDYLQKGSYTVYAISKDSANFSTNQTKAISKAIKIDSRKQSVNNADLTILN